METPGLFVYDVCFQKRIRQEMLEEIIQDFVNQQKNSGQPLFDTTGDYESLVTRRNSIVEKWKNLGSGERGRYANQLAFERSENSPDLKNPELIPARNFHLVSRETQERINAHNALHLLPLETLDFDDSLLELAESLENIEELRALYKLRKRTTGSTKNAGIDADEAARIRNCLSQGRELYLAGMQGSLMVKPLNFFYALTAYAYGVIVLNNPLRYAKSNLPGSHGMEYLPDIIQARFGGSSPRGTFSDLVTSFPAQLIKNPAFEMSVNCVDSVVNFYGIQHSVGLGTLLSMIPEMTEYYKLTTQSGGRCHPLEITNAMSARSLTWEFHIGDGETEPPAAGIENSFPGLTRLGRHGKIVVTVPASAAGTIRPCIYTDIRGKLWYIDNPFFPVILPEIAVHFLINSIFSNIMRYRPDEWGSVVVNNVSSNISLITRHYFSSFQRKFLLVILRSLSRYIPYAA